MPTPADVHVTPGDYSERPNTRNEMPQLACYDPAVTYIFDDRFWADDIFWPWLAGYLEARRARPTRSEGFAAS